MEDVVLITPPAQEPVTLQQFKDHCRVTTSADDNYISTVLIPAIRDLAEVELCRALITQTWRFKLDGFPAIDPLYAKAGYAKILLPKPPFQAIKSFTYVDPAGVLQTLHQCNPDGTAPGTEFYGYQVTPGDELNPARLQPPWAKPWPPARLLPAAVQIEFDCGYGAFTGSPAAWTPRDIPAAIRQAILMAGLHLYDNRWGVDAQKLSEVPMGVKTLFDGYRNWSS